MNMPPLLTRALDKHINYDRAAQHGKKPDGRLRRPQVIANAFSAGNVQR
jgi:hypothetical protein